MARRWSDLGDKSKRRYLGAGRSGKLTGESLSDAQTRRYYERGGTMAGGRGHSATPEHGSRRVAPREATDRYQIGFATDADRKSIDRWRRRNSPDWIPKSKAIIGDDTAAALSRIDLSPRYWKDVTVTANPDGTLTMRVTSKRGGRDRVTTLPDQDAMSEVGRLLNESSRIAMTPPKQRKKLEKAWRNAAGDQYSFGVGFHGYGKGKSK
jgi:hypothetical protein